MTRARIIAIVLAVVLVSSFIFGGTLVWQRLSATTSPQVTEPPPTPEPPPAPEPVKLVPYQGPIYHMFFHCLIAFPDIAYSPTGGKGTLDRDCVTVTEFKRTLDELYKNNYVLVDIRSTYEVVTENGQSVVKDKQLMVPEGKKPLVMSIDDMVYDPRKMGYGMVDKIILDDKGRLATYTRHKSGEEVISRDNEIIPILEGFVEKHPDFSFEGAKATLALTGWVGILGYRIDADAPNRESEIAAVKPIIAKLEEKGWHFACHGYGHYNAQKITAAKFESDVLKWKTEIEPVVGPTDIYVYPYGATVELNSAHYQVLLNNGFRLMCGVGMKPYWKNYGHSVLMSRQVVDGYSLRFHGRLLAPLLNTAVVYDREVRPTPEQIKLGYSK